ncbi:hypothetical protein, partial [Escherichia coli]|uniref:hypothetical protein n=1 Tax=Escherichia coli TaxID=562 RepID=UPI0030C6AF37
VIPDHDKPQPPGCLLDLPLFSVSTGCRVDPDQVVIVRRCGRRYYNCTSCPVSLGRIMAQHIN